MDHTIDELDVWNMINKINGEKIKNKKINIKITTVCLNLVCFF